jgi:hypothetical protein
MNETKLAELRKVVGGLRPSSVLLAESLAAAASAVPAHELPHTNVAAEPSAPTSQATHPISPIAAPRPRRQSSGEDDRRTSTTARLSSQSPLEGSMSPMEAKELLKQKRQSLVPVKERPPVPPRTFNVDAIKKQAHPDIKAERILQDPTIRQLFAIPQVRRRHRARKGHVYGYGSVSHTRGVRRKFPTLRWGSGRKYRSERSRPFARSKSVEAN